MTDLESRIFLAIAKTMPTKQPAAVLAEIETTHVLVDLARWERIKTNNDRIDSAIRNTHVIVKRDRFERLIDAANMAADEWGAESRVGLQPGDLDPLPIRQNAAKSDTSESTT